jgi:hypothetical protein
MITLDFTNPVLALRLGQVTYAERMSHLLRNARAIEARIAALHFEDRCDELLRGPFRPWSLTDSGREQQSPPGPLRARSRRSSTRLC